MALKDTVAEDVTSGRSVPAATADRHGSSCALVPNRNGVAALVLIATTWSSDLSTTPPPNMKERITYLLHVGEEGFDPSRLTVTKESLALPPIKAAKEHRLTLGLSELPHEVAIRSLKLRRSAKTL